MSSEHLTVSPTPQLDFYFNGIRIEFDRLNKELDDAKKQRDEYKTNYMNRERGFQDFITTLLQRLNDRNQTCQHCRGDITYTAGLADDNASILPPAPSSECYLPLEKEGSVTDQPENTEISVEISPVEEERNHNDDVRRGAISDEDLTISGITSPPLRSDKISTNEVGKPRWEIIYNDETDIAWKLDLVHELTGTNVAFSPDGTYLAVTSGDVACLFDADTGERISVMRDLYKNPSEGVPSITCLGFSPDNKYLATGDTSGKVRIWTISQKRVRKMFRHREFITDLQFSPNGQHLLTSSFDWTVRIWRLRDGSSTILNGGKYIPAVFQFNPDGRYVATRYGLGRILIWNVRTRRLVARWEAHGDAVSSLVFTPDGKGLLTGSWDRAVVCWDIGWLSSSGDNVDVNSTVMEISRFKGHMDRVCQVSISPTGKWIASCSKDRTVRIWNTRDATLQCTLHSAGEVSSVAFSPVGTYLAIAVDFCQVTVWNYTCRDSNSL